MDNTTSGVCSMQVQDGQLPLTREELYEQVWTTPMRKLAPGNGLSDVGLKKVCTKHKIPTPQVGYWAKKEFGKRVRQTPLPPPDDPALGTIHLRHEAEPKLPGSGPPPPPVADPDLVKLYLFETDPQNAIQVPDHLRSTHPIIQRTRDAEWVSSDWDRYNHGYPECEIADGCVDISVAKQSVPRALRLMNSLFQALEKRGHRVEVRPQKPGYSSQRSRVRCLMLGEQFGFCLREKTKMVQIPEAERRQSSLFVNRVRYDHTGQFELRLMGESGYATATWTDRQRGKIEARLNAVIIRMLVVVGERRRWRERQTQEEASRLAREQERREQERHQQIERSRIEKLEALADRWQKAHSLRAFLQAVQDNATRKIGRIDPKSDLTRWLEWAFSYARSLDPLEGIQSPSGEELEGERK
jgi:hypothetical protein